MNTLISFFEQNVKKFADNPYLWEHLGKEYISSSYSQIHQSVQNFASGLIKQGIQKGDHIALLSEGRNDWVIAELGMLFAGAVNVPLSVKLDEPSELEFRLNHSEAKYIIVSASQSKKIESIRNALPKLINIIHLDDASRLNSDDLLFSEILTAGEQGLIDNRDGFDKRKNSVKADDYANISYTSGTTADPKGIILSHKNYVTNIKQSGELIDIPSHFRTLLILPWDHSFAHTVGIYGFMSKGASIASIQSGRTGMETLKNIPKNIKELQPHLLLSVPALAKNFRKNIEKGVREQGEVIKKLFSYTLKVGYQIHGNGWDKPKQLMPLKRLFYNLMDKILLAKIRENFGGNLKFFIGGGALLELELQNFYAAIGIPMYQGYGLSEAAPVISSNGPLKCQYGTSGALVNHLELKICGDHGEELNPGNTGEIVIRGENVMRGYWNNPEATRESLRDGWLYTGDLGFMASDGFLHVLGRFKSLLISNDGEKFSPEGIEESLVEQSRYIDQCVLFNNQMSYTIALIVPNQGPILFHLKEMGLSIDSVEGQTEAINKIQQEINAYRKGGKYEGLFPERWLPSTFGILNDAFTEKNHLINSTMKMVRGKINERYEDLIAYLYTAEGKQIQNLRNRKAVLHFGKKKIE
ncbi:MAG: AMP-binding protein [Bacteroidales bacterium]|nr:AMP-binding protein [Bacteroidales bacterium]